MSKGGVSVDRVQKLLSGLVSCVESLRGAEESCEKCPYCSEPSCKDQMMCDTIAYIILNERGKPTDHFYADCPLPDVTDNHVGKWISVKDGLPNEGEEVLVWNDEGFCYVDEIKNGKWKIPGDYSGNTHWMPILEPPKEET